MNRNPQRRIAATIVVAVAALTLMSAGCVSHPGPMAQSANASAVVAQNSPQAAIQDADQTPTVMPGSLQDKLARQFNRLRMPWRPSESVHQEDHEATVSSHSIAPRAARRTSTQAPAATDVEAAGQDTLPTDENTSPRVDAAVQPVGYEQVPGEKHYANPTPLSRDAHGLVPGDPLLVAPYAPGPYPSPALPHPGYDGFGPPVGQPHPMNDGSVAPPPQWTPESPGATNSAPPEELPLPMPIDERPPRPSRGSPYSGMPGHVMAPSTPWPARTTTFSDAPHPQSRAHEFQGEDAWSSLTVTGQGYLAQGSTMHGSQLRDAPLTATEIALQLKQENETLRERMQFAEAAQHRAEKRLAAVETELAKLNRELDDAKQSIARLSLANRKLNEQLAAEHAEKERIRQHSDAALRNIEQTLDTVLLNTISPPDK